MTEGCAALYFSSGSNRRGDDEWNTDGWEDWKDDGSGSQTNIKKKESDTRNTTIMKRQAQAFAVTEEDDDFDESALCSAKELPPRVRWREAMQMEKRIESSAAAMSHILSKSLHHRPRDIPAAPKDHHGTKRRDLMYRFMMSEDDRKLWSTLKYRRVDPDGKLLDDEETDTQALATSKIAVDQEDVTIEEPKIPYLSRRDLKFINPERYQQFIEWYGLNNPSAARLGGRMPVESTLKVN
jgi:hypothetical protein